MTLMQRPAAGMDRGGAPLRVWSPRALHHLLHVLVALAMLVAVADLSHSDFQYARAAKTDWANLLFEPGKAPSDRLGDETALATREQVRATAERFVGVYYGLFPSDSVEYYQPDGRGLELVVVRGGRASLNETVVPLLPGNLGPLDLPPAQLDEFYEQLHLMRLQFGVRRFSFNAGRRTCLDWTVFYSLAFDTRARLTGRLHYTTSFCPGQQASPQPSLTLVSLSSVLLFSIASLVWMLLRVLRPRAIRAKRERHQLRRRRRREARGRLYAGDAGIQRSDDSGGGGRASSPRRSLSPQPSFSVSLLSPGGSSSSSSLSSSSSSSSSSGFTSDEAVLAPSSRRRHHRRRRRRGPPFWVPSPGRGTERDYALWWSVYAATDAVNIAVAVLLLHRRYAYEKVLSGVTLYFFLGLGAMLAWVRLVPAAKALGPKYAALATTLNLAAPFLGRFTLGAAPIYVGFAFFAVQVFGTTTRKFQNMGQAAQSLYAIMNGDMLLDSYVALQLEHHVMGEIFLYVFMLLFITIVSKMVLSGVEYFYFRTTPATEVVEYVEVTKERIQRRREGGGVAGAAGPAPLLPAPEEAKAAAEKGGAGVASCAAACQAELLSAFAAEAAAAGLPPEACEAVFRGACEEARDGVGRRARGALEAAAARRRLARSRRRARASKI